MKKKSNHRPEGRWCTDGSKEPSIAFTEKEKIFRKALAYSQTRAIVF
jgi:hypothetical protein